MIKYLIIVFLFGCTPKLMKITTTKAAVSVSTVTQLDRKYKRSLKDSVNVMVEIIKQK